MEGPREGSNNLTQSNQHTPSSIVNNEDNSLSSTMKSMSLSSANMAPAAPASSTHSHENHHENGNFGVIASPARPFKTPLRRAPSASSLGSNEKPSSPALHRKTSLSSLKSAGGSTPPRSPNLRRSSSYFHNLSMGDRSSLPPPVEEAPKPPPTAASIAKDFFEKELAVKHGNSEMTKNSETVVILQDACYGHRYSRPRTSKSNLSTIVERPERIQASVLGVAAAYVRLGGRHAEGSAAPNPKTDVLSMPAAPFKIQKTDRTVSLRSAAATNIHGTKWMEELTAMCERAESKLAMNEKELARTVSFDQTSGEQRSQKPTLHEGDLYLCSESLNALEGALGGVCAGIDAVFEENRHRRAFVCIRPPGHHCAADMPSGFCWINNVHIGIAHAIATHGLTHAAIIDFDLHHGDGSQSITWAHNARLTSMAKNTPITKKAPIGYFSLHDINSYPCEEGDEEKVRNASLCIENAHGQSIWNIHLQPWKTIAEFWALYEDRYLVVLAKARAFLRAHSDRLRQAPTRPRPKAAIFLSAGFDASEWEGSGMQRHQVNVPTEFYARFTQDVVAMAEEENLGVDGRVISVLEGGYSDRALMSGVMSHISGMVATAKNQFPQEAVKSEPESTVNGHVGPSGLSYGLVKPSSRDGVSPRPAYDPKWWSLPMLEEIENVVNPHAQASATKGQRSKIQPTFTSPTESFIAKVNPTAQGRRSTSGSGAMKGVVVTQASRGPSPPPPEVGWATAAHELSNLLVPQDRETKSCKPEDLNAEATRKRRDRQSNIGIPTEAVVGDTKPVAIRETRHKGVKPMQGIEENKKLPSRTSRRRTMADISLLNEEATIDQAISGASVNHPTTSITRRRSSVASSVGSISTLATDRASEFSVPSTTDNNKTKAPLAVRKTRAPAASRPEINKPKAVKKPEPPMRAPSSDSVSASNNTSSGPSVVAKAPLSENAEKRNEDVDQLTSGMKTMSIKLNVPPKEEYEARQQQKTKPAPRGRPATKSTGPKVTKPRSPTKSKAKMVPNGSQNPKAVPTSTEKPPNLPHPSFAPTVNETEQPVLSSADSIERSDKDFPTNACSEPQQLSIDQQSIMEIDEASSDLANSTRQPSFPTTFDGATEPPVPTQAFAPPPPKEPSTPTTVRRITKQDLPIFTSTSPIPFGKPRSSIDQTMETVRLPTTNSLMGTSQDAGNVPQTVVPTLPPDAYPNRQAPSSEAPSNRQPLNNSSTQHATGLEPLKGVQKDDPTLLQGRQTSIWDVPDTPQPPPPSRKP